MPKEIVEQQTDWVKDPQNALIALDKQSNANIQALALQLGYDGSLTVGALEDEIRFYQRRTVEACLELGKRLLLLKEMTPYGEFKQRIELLGMNYRMANRFMSATLKFAKSDTKSLLKVVGNQTKLLELITLDDDEIIELNEGGSARGITLDSISTMSVTELRKALRDAKADTEAKDALLAKKDEKLNELDTELTRRTSPTVNVHLLERQEKERNAIAILQNSSNAMLLATQQFHQALHSVNDFTDIVSVNDKFNETVNYVYQQIAQISLEMGIQVDFEEIVNPSWAQPLAQDD